MEATSAWFETLDDAMDLLTTSRRFTCRSNRIVTRCAMDSIDIDATTTTRRAARCGFDAVKIDFSMPRRSSDRGFDFDYDDASGIRNTFFEDYCDFPKSNIKTTTSSGNYRLKPVTSTPFRSEEHFCKGSKTRLKTLETDSTDIHLAENEELKRKYQNIQEENLKLQAVITDLTQVNKRWQKYNNDRQMYVQKLLNTIQDQQEQLNQISEVRAFSKSQSFSDSAFSSSSTSGELSESALDRLKSVEQKLKERVELLEFQVKAHRDDWEAELNEKRQALQDKEAAQRRATDLLAELQSLKKAHLESLERRKSTVMCHCCGQPLSTATEQPLHNRLYRTALHLPYPSSRSDERTTVSESDDIVVDSSDKMYNANNNSNSKTGSCSSGGGGEMLINITEDPKLLQLEEQQKLISRGDNQSISPNGSHQSSSSSIRDLWDIQQPGATGGKVENEISYSRSSTVPLVQSTASGTSLHEGETTAAVSYRTNGQQTVTSSVRIPIAKSSSAPVRKTNRPSVRDVPRMSLDSIRFSATSPPITLISTATAPIPATASCDYDNGVATLTSDDVICPGCGTVFPPKLHLKFLDHFESCQTANRNHLPNNCNPVLESANRY